MVIYVVLRALHFCFLLCAHEKNILDFLRNDGKVIRACCGLQFTSVNMLGGFVTNYRCMLEYKLDIVFISQSKSVYNM
ncbi:hypothetical protein L2E82_16707 [Cichorium intybus]|uniref:Uncharacterized protein n=1 Tax=Cichorium intybus TaxID=13427 RepID=A0ACB9F6A9_CICIN|nr:hypothetical protein L2E82_16707 [Cichorium intybus]